MMHVMAVVSGILIGIFFFEVLFDVAVSNYGLIDSKWLYLFMVSDWFDDFRFWDYFDRDIGK